MSTMEQAGVRELRQNLSVYLRRVLDGHSFEVTERGRPVALLVPLPTASTPLTRLVASGRAAAPKGDLVDLGPPGDAPSRRGSEALSR
jgi:prevent-host-death family protein